MAVDSVTSTSPAIAERDPDIKPIKPPASSTSPDSNSHCNISATAAAIAAAAAVAATVSGSHSIDSILGIKGEKSIGIGRHSPNSSSLAHYNLLHSLHHHHPHHHYLNFNHLGNNNNHEKSEGNRRIGGSLSDEGAVSSEEGHQADFRGDISCKSGTMNLTNYEYINATSRGGGSDTSDEPRRGVKRAIKELNSSDLSAGKCLFGPYFSVPVKKVMT